MISASPTGEPIRFRPGFSAQPELSHVVFDFDGTLSWLRHGWPQIMCGVFEGCCPNLPGESDEQKRAFLLEDLLALNGKPSIYQMRRCAEWARLRGGPAPDPHHLLREYQDRLDAAIAERSARIRSGAAAAEDFVVHGARAFLETLRGRGLTLIILSGTIEHRVREEADLLNLTGFFGQHIYGSSGDGTSFSKADVIDRLFREEGITGEHLLSFGDGPVEIEVTKARGGLAVAVASDEETNGSGRLYPYKTKLLETAGADALIPDFREASLLLEYALGTRTR
jgi:phosphoglycolate phosphatase